MSWCSPLILAATHIGCFVGGLVVMRWLARRGLEAADHAVHHDTTTSREHAMPQRRAPLVILSIVLGMVLFGVGVRVGVELVQDQLDCFNEYANQNADSQESRSRATEALQKADARRDLAILAVISPGNDEADIRELRIATARKVAKQAELQRQREANPYPDPPREVCPSE